MKLRILVRTNLLAAATGLLLVSGAVAAGEKVVVYGADITPAQQQELGQLFGSNPATRTDTVTTPEMVEALQGSGLPAAPSDRSISSSALTCQNKGDGLDVRTSNITRITAPVYANALVTAGATDASVLIAAPQADPVTGETALVGVLKGLPQCQAGKPLDASRVSLAYKQVAWTVALAGPTGDVNKAAALMAGATQPVMTGQATDDPSIGNAIDAASTAQGMPVDPNLRPSLIAFLRGFAGQDYGAYAKGYRIEQPSPGEVKVLGASPASAAGATGEAFSGQVQQVGPPLIVRSNGQDRQVQPAANLAVTRNGKTARLADLRKGDTVNVVANTDGSVQRIGATGQSAVPDWARRLPPLNHAVMLMGILIWLLAVSPRANRREGVAVAGRLPAAGRPTTATGL
jgi:uncharacterized protein YpuA (DUF1002 family)